jgi:hypothetical protein
VSLVLDALKKLERDKETSPPGVLVVGAVPWQGVRRRHSPFLALALAGLLALAALTLGAWWLSRKQPTRVSVAPPAPPAARAATDGTAPPSATAMPASAPPERRLTLPQPGTNGAAPLAASGPRHAVPTPRNSPQLNAISQQDGKPVAVIDGRLVREGDSVGGIRVLRIGETEVEVEVHGQRRTLRF